MFHKVKKFDNLSFMFHKQRSTVSDLLNWTKSMGKFHDYKGKLRQGVKHFGKLRYACALRKVIRRDARLGGAVKTTDMMGREKQATGFSAGIYLGAVLCYDLEDLNLLGTKSAIEKQGGAPH